MDSVYGAFDGAHSLSCSFSTHGKAQDEKGAEFCCCVEQKTFFTFGLTQGQVNIWQLNLQPPSKPGVSRFPPTQISAAQTVLFICSQIWDLSTGLRLNWQLCGSSAAERESSSLCWRTQEGRARDKDEASFSLSSALSKHRAGQLSGERWCWTGRGELWRRGGHFPDWLMTSLPVGSGFIWQHPHEYPA